MIDLEFKRVVQEARGSLLWRAAIWADTVIESAWMSSFVGRAWRRQRAIIAAWPAERRVRIAALTLAWAGVGHALSLVVLPPYVTSALPRAWVALFIVSALVVAAQPAAFVRAWNDRYGQKSRP
ncbi:MAG: hypothetical protein ACRD2A_09915 [Vicinamibacterales bacterium]